MKTSSNRGSHHSAGAHIEIPQVPTLRDIVHAKWVDSDVRILDGVGPVRALDTSGGGQCAMHGMLGIPNVQGHKYFRRKQTWCLPQCGRHLFLHLC